MDRFWIDGKCKACGCLVIERGSKQDWDYENTCTNPKCKNYGWHDVGTQEELEYYEHDTKLIENIPNNSLEEYPDDKYIVENIDPEVIKKFKETMLANKSLSDEARQMLEECFWDLV